MMLDMKKGLYCLIHIYMYVGHVGKSIYNQGLYIHFVHLIVFEKKCSTGFYRGRSPDFIACSKMTRILRVMTCKRVGYMYKIIVHVHVGEHGFFFKKPNNALTVCIKPCRKKPIFIMSMNFVYIVYIIYIIIQE